MEGHNMFEPVKLTFDKDDLEPYISEQNVQYHYNKHTRGYFKKLNELTKDTLYENMSLDQVVKKVFKKADNKGMALFDNAAQAWNHDFYWQGLTPKNDNNKPSEQLLKQIGQDFKDLDDLKEKFVEKAVKQFGSGWCWLVFNKQGKLEIYTTANAITPLVFESVPILTCDVWEHAYYLTTYNDREKYVRDFWNIVNWEFVNGNYDRATKED